MIFQAILVAISALAAFAYLVRYRLRPASRRRTVIKVIPAAMLALAAIVVMAPLTLVLFFATAAITDAALAREDERGFYSAMAAALLSQIFLCLTLYLVWTGMDAPLVAALGLAGIWAGYFMLIWGGLKRSRPIIIVYSLGVLAGTYLALGTTTLGQLAVVGMLLYVFAQLLMSLEYFLLDARTLEARLAGHTIWLSYYGSLVLFFVALRG